MAKIFFGILILLMAMPGSSLALTADTVGGDFACFSESDFEDLVNFVASGDKASVKAYVKQRKCIVLKKGLTVTVLKSPGMFGGKAQCAFSGVKFWTAREALENWR